MPSIDDLDRRIRRIEDREAIRVLVGRYALAMDDKDFDLAETLFTPDARFVWADGSSAQEGRDAIIRMYREKIAAAGPSFHVTHDQFVEFAPGDDAQATGLVLCHAEVLVGGRQHVAAIRYHDRYRKVAERWLFEERKLAFLYHVPAAEYDGVLLKADRIRLGGGARPAHWP